MMSGVCHEIAELERLDWYHPNASRHVAESLLMQNGEDGSYLMRPSTGDREMAISIRCKDSVKHYKVTWNGDCYAFGLATFKSYDEFISHFQKQPFIAGESGVITWLRHPYPRQVSEPAVYDVVRIHAQYGPDRTSKCPPQWAIGSKEGFMTKLGAIIKNWKHRWFVLKRNELSYFRTQADHIPIRTIDLRKCKECEVDNTQNRPNCFRLVLPWRTFYLVCETELELQDWMHMIQWKLTQLSTST